MFSCEVKVTLFSKCLLTACPMDVLGSLLQGQHPAPSRSGWSKKTISVSIAISPCVCKIILLTKAATEHCWGFYKSKLGGLAYIYPFHDITGLFCRIGSGEQTFLSGVIMIFFYSQSFTHGEGFRLKITDKSRTVGQKFITFLMKENTALPTSIQRGMVPSTVITRSFYFLETRAKIRR